MRVIRKIFWIIIVVIVLLIISYNIYSFYMIKVLKKDFVSVCGYTAFDVASGSMAPAINIGDIILIDTKASNYKKNDIVTYRDKEGLIVTHRITNIHKDKMVTKGDANNTQDKEIETSRIVGKYVFKISKGSKIISALKKPLIISMILFDGIIFSIYVSIDKRGDIILDSEEKEYAEFKKYLETKK